MLPPLTCSAFCARYTSAGIPMSEPLGCLPMIATSTNVVASQCGQLLHVVISQTFPVARASFVGECDILSRANYCSCSLRRRRSSSISSFVIPPHTMNRNAPANRNHSASFLPMRFIVIATVEWTRNQMPIVIAAAPLATPHFRDAQQFVDRVHITVAGKFDHGGSSTARPSKFTRRLAEVPSRLPSCSS